jgi:hypothetical protein
MLSKRIFCYILIFIQCTIGCNTQDKEKGIINPKKVAEINIVNKVYCHSSNLIREKVNLTDRVLIDNLIGALNDAKPINRFDIRPNVNYGFFEIEFNEDSQAHSFAIQYTVYDGVVIRNMENGDCLRNDFLEILVYKLFL